MSAATRNWLHAAAFPKKQGAELEKAGPYVNEVYARAYPKAKPLPNCHLRASAAGQLLHITYHTIPHDRWRSLRWTTLAAFASVWLLLYPLSTKFTGLALASLYTVVESSFTAVERGAPYTSLGQFGANLIYMPVLLGGYQYLLADASPLLFIGLYPLNVWLLEVVEEFCILRPVFGRNVAWCYLDYADEWLSGCVRCGHAPCWWVFGAVVLWTQTRIESASIALATALMGAE